MCRGRPLWAQSFHLVHRFGLGWFRSQCSANAAVQSQSPTRSTNDWTRPISPNASQFCALWAVRVQSLSWVNRGMLFKLVLELISTRSILGALSAMVWLPANRCATCTHSSSCGPALLPVNLHRPSRCSGCSTVQCSDEYGLIGTEAVHVDSVRF